jgi:hypothetical protein
VCLEEPVDVLEAAVGGFRVEEVGDGDEGEADDSLCFSRQFGSGLFDGRGGGGGGTILVELAYPDDPEFVAQVLDSGEGCLDYGVVLEGG